MGLIVAICLDFCCVNLVILCMSSYEANPNHTVSIVDSNNQSVMVAFYVKHYPVIFPSGSTWIIFLNVIRPFPFCLFRFLVPCFQLLLAVGMFFPKVPQCFSGNNSQAIFSAKIISSSQNGNLIDWFIKLIIKANS